MFCSDILNSLKYCDICMVKGLSFSVIESIYARSLIVQILRLECFEMIIYEVFENCGVKSSLYV